MKKSVVYILAVILAVSVLSGCKSTTNEGTATPSPAMSPAITTDVVPSPDITGAEETAKVTDKVTDNGGATNDLDENTKATTSPAASPTA